jgi:hypothetical protein
MSTEQNKAQRRIVGELNRGNWAIVDELAPAASVYRGSAGAPLRGREASALFVAQFGAAFPDFHMPIENIIGLQRFKAMRYFLGL